MMNRRCPRFVACVTSTAGFRSQCLRVTRKLIRSGFLPATPNTRKRAMIVRCETEADQKNSTSERSRSRGLTPEMIVMGCWFASNAGKPPAAADAIVADSCSTFTDSASKPSPKHSGHAPSTTPAPWSSTVCAVTMSTCPTTSPSPGPTTLTKAVRTGRGPSCRPVRMPTEQNTRIEVDDCSG